MLSDHCIMLSLIALVLTAFILKLLSSKRNNKASKPHLPLYPPSPPSLPIIGHLHLLKPLIHQAFKDLSDQYGPLILIRIGSTRFAVVSTPSLAKETLKINELTYSSRKMNMAINLVTYHDATFAFAPFNAYWKFIKKLSTTELLGNRTLNQFLPIRTRELHEFIQTLTQKSKAKERVNLSESLLKLSNNIISQMMLSIKSSGTDSQAEEARELVRQVTKIFGEFNVSDFLGFLKVLDLQGFKKRAMQIHRRYDALLERIIFDREELRRKRKGMNDNDGEERVKDFLDILLDVSEEKDCEIKLTRNHIKSLILDYFTAATDTTAISVEWAISELHNNPRVLKKAQEEVDRVSGGNERLVCEADIGNLPYINAVIKETLRLHPPITLLMRKGIADCVIDSYMIPKGSLMCVNIWAMGRDPKVWESPLEFRPERFLEGGSASGIDNKGHHFELLPFGTGRRGCPGMPLAMKELPTIIGAMVQCFEWKMFGSDGQILEDGVTVDMDERPGLTAPRARDLVCIPVSRVNTTFLQV